MAGNVRINGTWRTLYRAYVKVNGTWRSVTYGYAKNNTVWRQVLVPPVTVPNVVGSTLSAATTAITSSGNTVGTSTAVTSGATSGNNQQIITQSVASGYYLSAQVVDLTYYNYIAPTVTPTPTPTPTATSTPTPTPTTGGSCISSATAYGAGAGQAWTTNAAYITGNTQAYTSVAVSIGGSIVATGSSLPILVSGLSAATNYTATLIGYLNGTACGSAPTSFTTASSGTSTPTPTPTPTPTTGSIYVSYGYCTSSGSNGYDGIDVTLFGYSSASAYCAEAYSSISGSTSISSWVCGQTTFSGGTYSPSYYAQYQVNGTCTSTPTPTPTPTATSAYTYCPSLGYNVLTSGYPGNCPGAVTPTPTPTPTATSTYGYYCITYVQSTPVGCSLSGPYSANQSGSGTGYSTTCTQGYSNPYTCTTSTPTPTPTATATATPTPTSGGTTYYGTACCDGYCAQFSGNTYNEMVATFVGNCGSYSSLSYSTSGYPSCQSKNCSGSTPTPTPTATSTTTSTPTPTPTATSTPAPTTTYYYCCGNPGQYSDGAYNSYNTTGRQVANADCGGSGYVFGFNTSGPVANCGPQSTPTPTPTTTTTSTPTPTSACPPNDGRSYTSTRSTTNTCSDLGLTYVCTSGQFQYCLSSTPTPTPTPTATSTSTPTPTSTTNCSACVGWGSHPAYETMSCGDACGNTYIICRTASGCADYNYTNCPACNPTPTPTATSTPAPTATSCSTCVSYGGACGTYGNGTWCITPGSCPNICQGDYAPATSTPAPTSTPASSGNYRCTSADYANPSNPCTCTSCCQGSYGSGGAC